MTWMPGLAFMTSRNLVAGDNITLATGSNGAVTISAATGSGGGGGLTYQQVLGMMALGGF